MECKHVVELLSAYIDDECTSDEKLMIEEHLKTCESCQKEYDELKVLLDGLELLEEVEVPDSFRSDVMAKVYEIERAHKVLKRQVFFRYAKGIAAIFVFVLVFSFFKQTMFLEKSADEAEKAVMETQKKMAETMMGSMVTKEKYADMKQEANEAKKAGEAEKSCDKCEEAYREGDAAMTEVTTFVTDVSESLTTEEVFDEEVAKADSGYGTSLDLNNSEPNPTMEFTVSDEACVGDAAIKDAESHNQIHVTFSEDKEQSQNLVILLVIVSVVLVGLIGSVLVLFRKK